MNSISGRPTSYAQPARKSAEGSWIQSESISFGQDHVKRFGPWQFASLHLLTVRHNREVIVPATAVSRKAPLEALGICDRRYWRKSERKSTICS
jgi:hypothetical protein